MSYRDLNVIIMISDWIRVQIFLFQLFQGKIIVKEHITYGFENFPKAFVDLFTGDNFGKAVVIVGDSSKL